MHERQSMFSLELRLLLWVFSINTPTWRKGRNQTVRNMTQLGRKTKTKDLLVNQGEDPCGQAELHLRAASCFTPPTDQSHLSESM